MAPIKTNTVLAVDFAHTLEQALPAPKYNAEIFRFPVKNTEVYGPKVISSLAQYHAQIQMLEEMKAPKKRPEGRLSSRLGIGYFCE